MIIALASPRVALTLDEGMGKIKRFLFEAAAQGAGIVCFPEAYLPGLRGVGIDVLPFGESEHARVLHDVAEWAKAYRMAAIIGMERLTEAQTFCGRPSSRRNSDWRRPVRCGRPHLIGRRPFAPRRQGRLTGRSSCAWPDAIRSSASFMTD